jgi:hypothetical protein
MRVSEHERPRTVWILGSGFSKGLGGPLLHELLTPKGLIETTDHYPNLPNRELVYEVFQNYGPSGARYWEHAEDFLDFVDAAIEEPTSKRRLFLERLVKGRGGDKAPSVADFRTLAILAVAAECSTFVDRGSVDSEAWEPYVDWARKRRVNDTVITFNYDQVPEKLGTAPFITHFGEPTVVRPGGTSRVPESNCPIYKLHGSTTWGIDRTGGFSAFDTNQFVSLKGEPGNIYRNLIATPGATKLSHCAGLLSPLWENAILRLTKADVIVFMGYRFPPSDSFSRRMLMGAIEQNSQPYLRIHTVLGPAINGDATVRLVSMLKHVLEGRGRKPRPPGTVGTSLYDIVAQPLYVEDFLTLVTERALYGEPNNL